MAGVHKGVVLAGLDLTGPDVGVLAVGDDRTDEDLFQALPSSASAVVVGRQPSTARFRVDDSVAVRRLLDRIITLRRSRP
jgi:trehalose 6-phosphate synthase/phosphatase